MDWMSGGYWTGNWFHQTRKRRIHSWRPRYVQPDAACFNQDSWTQRQGNMAAELYPKSFDDQVDAADFFEVAFDIYPEFAERTSRPIKGFFCACVMEHPLFASMRSQTRLDVTQSHVAASVLGEIYKRGRNELGGEPTEGAGEGEDGAGDGENEGQGGGSGLTDEQKDSIRKRVQQAMEKTQGAIDEARKLADAFGTKAGTGEGTPSHGDIEKFLKVYQEYKDNKFVQKIVKFAGRCRHIARSRQKGRTKYGADAFQGIEKGDSLERLLPDELTQMGLSEEAELELFARIIEGEAQCLETIGTSDAGQGPIILLVDESGSMEGFSTGDTLTKFEQAMGLALTTVWIARAQKRWVGLYTFCCGPKTRRLILDPNRPVEDEAKKLFDWITTFHPGGTDSYVQCKVVVDDVEKGLLGKVRGKADVLVISDGCISPNDGATGGSWEDKAKGVAARYKLWREKHNIRAKGLLVGETDPGFLKPLSDELHYAADMNEASKIADAVFSI